MNIIETFDHNNKTIEIYQDIDPQNPRDKNIQDNLDIMVCFHNRYNLGDEDHGYTSDHYNSWDEVKAQIIKDHDPVVILPLYLYDHSGITISTTPFHCPWDSGRVGFVFISRKAALENWSKKRVSPKMKKMCTEMIEGSVKKYDQYLTGDVYGFVIKDKDDNELDSCWGCYGLDYVKEQAKEAA